MLAALNLCNEATALPLPPAQPPIELPDQKWGAIRTTFNGPPACPLSCCCRSELGQTGVWVIRNNRYSR